MAVTQYYLQQPTKHYNIYTTNFIMRSLKVVTKVKEHGSDKVETREMLTVITTEENLGQLVQMAYGSWCEIIGYTYEPIEIHVSERYCHQVSARFLDKYRIEQRSIN